MVTVQLAFSFIVIVLLLQIIILKQCPQLIYLAERLVGLVVPSAEVLVITMGVGVRVLIVYFIFDVAYVACATNFYVAQT